MDNHKLVTLLYGDDYRTIPQIEELSPPRVLPEGAKVTRFAPSPTGFVHFGSLLPTRVSERLAHQSGGVFYLRVEDTDSKRRVEGAEEDLIRTYSYFQIQFDEGPESGAYGPYHQSARTDVYRAYAVKLLLEGRAYPCFATAEQLDEIRAKQESAGADPGYYGEWAVWRDADYASVEAQIKAGAPFVIRFRSEGDPSRKFKFTDLVKGALELPENHMDHVLLKSDGVPTYHFAHAVDDHLMRTTHVIRGDEWIASTPIHLQLFRLLGFKPPKYVHVSPIMKEDNGGRRKISKRKDPEAAVRFFAEEGYPADCVMEYLMTIASSDYEDWRRRNPDAPRSAYPFNLKKMSPSGALFDADKLNDVSKNVIGRMDAETVTAAVLEWAAAYAPDFYALLSRDPAYARGIFSIDRGGPKPRKDLAKWADAPDYAAYYFDESFSGAFELPENIDPADAVAILQAYREVYDPSLDKQAWFDSVKALCPALGFCPEVKEYKKNPGGYKGHAGDVSTVIRLAATGRRNTPDLCGILQLLGKERVLDRLDRAAARLKA